MNNLKKYLLERYPTVWNTHIIWILPLAIIAHFFFFGMGFLGLTDNVLADDYYYRWAENFEGLPLLLNFVISILLIVVWLIFVFKNNAFKHFYPIKRRQLLGQFVAYFVIVLSCISFFISFSAGEQVKVITKYTDSYIEAALEQCSQINDDSYNHSDNYNNYDEFTRDCHIAENAYNIKNKEFFKDYYIFTIAFMIAAYIVTLLIFAVKITGLRTTLLSIITGGILIIFLCILLFFITSLVSFRYEERVAMSVFSLFYLLILFCSVRMQQHFGKLISGILLNITMFFFLPILLIVGILLFDFLEYLSYHFDLYGLENVLYDIEYYTNDDFKIPFLLLNITIILCVIGFMGLYSTVMKQWKSLST